MVRRRRPAPRVPGGDRTVREAGTGEPAGVRLPRRGAAERRRPPRGAGRLPEGVRARPGVRSRRAEPRHRATGDRRRRRRGPHAGGGLRTLRRPARPAARRSSRVPAGRTSTRRRGAVPRTGAGSRSDPRHLARRGRRLRRRRLGPAADAASSRTSPSRRWHTRSWPGCGPSARSPPVRPMRSRIGFRSCSRRNPGRRPRSGAGLSLGAGRCREAGAGRGHEVQRGPAGGRRGVGAGRRGAGRDRATSPTPPRGSPTGATATAWKPWMLRPLATRLPRARSGRQGRGGVPARRSSSAGRTPCSPTSARGWRSISRWPIRPRKPEPRSRRSTRSRSPDGTRLVLAMAEAVVMVPPPGPGARRRLSRKRRITCVPPRPPAIRVARHWGGRGIPSGRPQTRHQPPAHSARNSGASGSAYAPWVK